ncbi:MAG: fumarate hydratase C-terminal domain-containing protein [Synergistetes bacterium]|nr:fumarate hydratase C-terminal domain-containing protein [Synergistota bacterium]
MEKHIITPVTFEEIADLSVGDTVFITGIVYTARDMAHLRIREILENQGDLPENFEGAVIFHAGPVVKKVNDEWKIWVIGPTTSTRMEPHSEMVGKLGVKVIVGKGGMGKNTTQALRKYGGVYLLAAPGCAVVHSESVEKVLRVHWLEELGVPEAIWVLKVNNWGPLIVGIDAHGNNMFTDLTKKATRVKDEILSVNYSS